MSAVMQERVTAEMPASDLDAEVKRTLTIAEFSKMSGFPRSTLYDLAAAGEFPCKVLRVGGRWYVPIDAAEELLSGKAA